MAVALEWKIGNATVRIHDDYCKDKTPEEVQAILRRVANCIQEEVAAAELGKELASGRTESESEVNLEKFLR